MNIWQALLQVDAQLFQWIQIHLRTQVGDVIIPWLRSPLSWTPLYMGMLIWCIRKYGWTALGYCLLTIIAVGLADFSSAAILKPMIAKIRPCYLYENTAWFHAIIPCGGQYAFPSNHAANHFAMAAIWFAMRPKDEAAYKSYWLFGWMLVVSFAQVYVGKHTPLDIIGGWLVGGCWAILCATLWRKGRAYYDSWPTGFETA